MNVITPEEVLGLLNAADAGLLAVAVPERNCTTIQYELGALKVVVFDDAGEWDYIESVTLPDGTMIGCEFEGPWASVTDWHPRSPETLDKIWHFWEASEYAKPT